MKNLTFKKIALGIFLAGYAASGAFAASLTANSKAYIKGTAPYFGDNKSTNVKITDASGGAVTSGSIKVGYNLTVSYTLSDDDGDNETALKSTAKTVTFYYYKNGAWNKATGTVDSNTAGQATITIGSEFSNATKIGYTINAVTDYGVPRFGEQLRVNDIASSTTPGVTPTDPDNGSGGGTDPDDTNGGTDGGGTGGGDTSPVGPTPDNPITNDDYKLYIVKGSTPIAAGSSFTADNASIYGDSDGGGVETNPIYGETFYAVVVDTSTTQVSTDSYTYAWTLTDTNTAAVAVDTALAVTGPFDTAITTQTITLATTNSDSMYGTATTGKALAGGQGFKLTATATPQ